MRSIGKWKIKKLKKIIHEEYNKKPRFGRPWMSRDNYQTLVDTINERIPEEWYDTWESAWSEIDRLVRDELTNLIYGRSS